MKSAKGKAEIMRQRSGKRLSYKQAVLAKCYECMGYYADGKLDCEIPDCPLYGFMPYRTVNKKFKSKPLSIAKNGISGDE